MWKNHPIRIAPALVVLTARTRHHGPVDESLYWVNAGTDKPPVLPTPLFLDPYSSPRDGLLQNP